MKKIILLGCILLGVSLSNLCTAQNLPSINTSKKTFDLGMDDSEDTPLIYGYETADATSKKLICFSTFTSDVENNPHKCALGAYYTTDDIEIQYIGTEGSFVKLRFIGSSKGDVVFYVEKKMVKMQ